MFCAKVSVDANQRSLPPASAIFSRYFEAACRNIERADNVLTLGLSA